MVRLLELMTLDVHLVDECLQAKELQSLLASRTCVYPMSMWRI
jgi:hypothetical protein